MDILSGKASVIMMLHSPFKELAPKQFGDGMTDDLAG
jgi:hypothetical protein